MNLALFDFDGTITSGDTWTPFMRFAVRPGRLLLGGVLLGPVAAGHRLGLLSASRGRRMAARVGFWGENASGVRQLGVEYAQHVLPRMVRPAALERIAWHTAQGDEVVVVSAALDVYLGPWCERLGLACISTILEERRGQLTGGYLHGDCCGAEKARRILQRYELGGYSRVYAYGDSAEDREMLELAHRKFYRWKEIASWDEVTEYGHPRPARPGHGAASHSEEPR
jgi:HAD superfamily hydrolase (TIGR01490 family)